jgi:hypothetical protein
MKIKIHSSLKNIRSMVAFCISLEAAVELAASTIVEAKVDYAIIVQLGDKQWVLLPEHYTVISK